jgi:hypothetical protein
MKKVIISFCLLLLAGASIYPQGEGRGFKYYRVDQVITIKGEIKEIKKEECYRSNNFMVIYLEEKKSGRVYRVEVSPDWFYNVDLMKGGSIEITGSYTKTKEQNLVIARSISFQGELYRFRDKHGFPLWQGKRRQMRHGGKGRQKRKGNF